MPDVQIGGNPQNLVLRKVTIANGDSASEGEATDGMALIGIIMPSTWTAADLGYQAAWDSVNGTYLTAVGASGRAETTVAAASTHILFPVGDAIFVPFIKIVSVAAGGGSTTPVTQGGARDLLLLFRRFLS